ncbi:MAG TPA: flagellar biosynthetic protein FliR [Polyangiaceae bacterium]|nr:flagellar biosynthetic protein FliR [Polyangiaceae bacterium]
MTGLDELLRAEAGAFALEAIRLGGMVAVAPLSWTNAPVRVKASLVLLLAFAVHGQSVVSPELAASAPRIAAGVGSEFLLGVSIGMIVRLVVAGVEVAAEQIALMMGLGIAQVFDPQVHGSHNVLSGILRNFALLVGVSVGLHRVVLGATIASFRIAPVGSLVGLGSYGPTFMTLGSLVFSTGIRLAMPVLAVLFMVQVALAFVSRAAPAVQVFSVGFAVTLGIGAFVIVLVLPDLAYEIAADMSQVGGRVESVLALAKEAPP